MVALMSDRDDAFRTFGPIFLEAIAIMTLDELNELRALHGLAPRTQPQAIQKLKAILPTLPPYDWMYPFL